MSEGDVALACMQALVDELVRGGLEHACLSPGSRSTPIALALWRHPSLTVHVHLDERASAFFALGLAKATGRPVALACTSGTAAANFFPAVVEAFLSRVPLLALTADRPPELRGVGANQTIDQIGLYGRHAKAFEDAAVPGDRQDEAYWRELARRSLWTAMDPPPGPVQLNLPFREPLVASDVGSTRIPAPEPGPPPDPPARHLPVYVVEEFVRLVESAERGVVLAGSLRGDAESALELVRRSGWPLIAEPTSGLRVPEALGAGQFLLANEGFADPHVPDVVLQLGSAPVSRAGLSFVASARDLVILDPDRLVADPARHASLTIEIEPGVLAGAMRPRRSNRAETAWLREWREADGLARGAVDGLLDSWDEPFEGRVARDLAACLPEGCSLVVGSSMPVRDLDAYMLPREGLRVLANRGASGIDGFVSTALGVAASGAPTYALCGDLTLLHDAGSLMWSAKRGPDAVFVVPNNDGGAIFSFLAQRELAEIEALFTTPHGLNLAELARAAGAGHVRVERAADLVSAVRQAHSAGGVWIVEVPSDRERNVARHAEVNAAVAAALAG